MTKLFPGLLLSLLVFSCTRDNTAQYEANPVAEQVMVETPSPVSFASFSSRLPVLPLPFKAGCSYAYVVGSRPDTAVASTYLKPEEQPYRRLTVNKDVTALLVLFPTDEILPRLRTYSREGVIIDEQDLKFAACGEEPGFRHREQFTIKKDLTIEHIDSTARWRSDAQDNELPGTRKLTVTRKKFKITPKGDIQEIK
ncbi:hypothetical protein TH63_15775 [Rufibacter radiotolerans]|uniref:Lipoprotein n=1 Tax=Rufibacter radiotolerans TaxID=1379910 RepID=A0A0H4VLR4_9BACT|nr:hypothetical protein [Rufibacter radiotolerans]AKQ46750.1 hypothetical protein TH63_15775 [Rufibacter radiotolerans]